MPRKLCIAVSVFFGLLTVLMALQWARSYRVGDFVICPMNKGSKITVISGFGCALAMWTPNPRLDEFTWETIPRESIGPMMCLDPRKRGFGIDPLSAPYWFLVAISATLSAAPWMFWQFSLRTLLIATTLVAVVLGLGVWLLR